MNWSKRLETNRRLLQFLGRVTLFALLLGLVNSTVVRTFQLSLSTFWSWLDFLILDPYPLLIVIVPGVGGLLAGALVYSHCPEARGEGVPLYIDSVQYDRGHFPAYVGLFEYISAFLVMGFRGSGGFVGPVVAITAHVSSRVQELVGAAVSGLLGTRKGNNRLGTVCGVAAGLGALFRVPLAGGVLAVEILSPTNLNYGTLFPALVASSAGSVAYRVLYESAPIIALEADMSLTPELFAYVLVTAVLAGLVGLFFVRGYNRIHEFFESLQLPRWFVPTLGGLLAGVVALVLGRETLGTGEILIGDLLRGRLLFGAVVFFLAGRILTTSFTIGSGGSAGFTFPAIVVGFLSGHLISFLDPGLSLAGHQALLVTGMAGVVASVMNIPLAVIVLSVELFGPGFAVPAVAGSVVGFHVGRSEIIYEYDERSLVFEQFGDS